MLHYPIYITPLLDKRHGSIFPNYENIIKETRNDTSSTLLAVFVQHFREPLLLTWIKFKHSEDK